MPEAEEEPTIECPNCGALVPVGAPRCFICEELMPERAKAEEKPQEPSPEELPVEKGVIEAPPPAQVEAVKPPEEPVAEKPPEEVPTPVEKVIEVAPPAPTPTEEKAAKLKAAYEAGRIPKEVYVGNLRALGLPVPPELEEAPEEAEVSAEVQPEPVIEEPPVTEEVEEKQPEEAPPEAAKPVEGIVAEPQEQPVKEELPAPVQPEPQVEVPSVEEEIAPPKEEEQPAAVPPVEKPEEIPPENVEIAPQKEEEKPAVAAPLEVSEKVPPTRPTNVAKKAARLKRAYKTGRITRELYVDSLKTLGVPIPEKLQEPPTKVEEPKAPSPETPPEIPPVKEETAPPQTAEPTPVETAPVEAAEGVPPVKEEVASPITDEVAPVEVAPEVKPEEAPPAKPSQLEKRASRLKKAYDSGKIAKETYLDGLRNLGLPIPPELEAPPGEEAKPEEEPAAEAPVEEVKEVPPAPPSEAEVKAAKLKAAYEAGKIPLEVYVGNLKILGLPVPPELEEGKEKAVLESAMAEVLSVTEEAAPEAIPEEIPQVEEEVAAEVPQEVEVTPEAVEEVRAKVEIVSKGEIETPARSYRGVAIASAGGLIYVLVWLIFIPILGNFLSFVFTALGAVLIVVGYNVASNDSAKAKRARTFKCPLCSERLEASISQCPNCGARFSD